MRAVRAKVVKGKIVTRAKFPDGTKLYLVVDEPVPPVELDAEDEAAIGRALASVRAGKGISLTKFRSISSRPYVG
jgi:ABC-type protease/lipase transport system fused ATPase/permease subunit